MRLTRYSVVGVRWLPTGVYGRPADCPRTGRVVLLDERGGRNVAVLARFVAGSGGVRPPCTDGAVHAVCHVAGYRAARVIVSGSPACTSSCHPGASSTVQRVIQGQFDSATFASGELRFPGSCRWCCGSTENVQMPGARGAAVSTMSAHDVHCSAVAILVRRMRTAPASDRTCVLLFSGGNMTHWHGFGERMPIVTYLTVPLAVYYRLVLDVLLEEESRLGIHLPTLEIDERVRAKLDSAPPLLEEMPPMDMLLESLHEWSNVDRIYNMRRSGTVEEFRHKDFLYQLTSEGARVHRTLTEIDQEMGAAGALQASMLPEVLEAARSLATVVEEPSGDIGCARAFTRLVRAFEELSGNAKLFVQGLNRALVVQGQSEVDSFLAYKEVVVGYLQNFLISLSRYAPQVAALILRAEAAGLEGLLPRIAAVEAAPQRGVPLNEVVDREAARMADQWAGLRNWFFEAGDRPAVAQTLQHRASDAVHQIMLTVHQLNDHRFRRVDRAADLVQLAVWFDTLAESPEEEVGALWRTAFGLQSARHLGVPRSEEDDEDWLEETSWWEGAPAPISAGYRASGPRRRPGPVPRVRSARRAKSLLATERGVHEQMESAAESALAARGPVRLAELGQLEEAEAEVLLRCLDTVLSVREDKAGIRRAKTTDGRLQVVLTPAREGAGAAVVGMRGGRITLADYQLTVHIAEDA